jgi:hypothetical protein
MATAAPQPIASLIGVFRTFGDYGPMYEVLGPAPRGPKGEMVAIRVFDSGEELDYPLADVLEDPLKA